MKGAAVTIALVASLVIGGLGGAWIASTHAAHRAAERQETTTAPVGPQAGIAMDAANDSVSAANPLGESADVVVAGKQLFTQMNCAGCHGYDGGGGMGPKLTDGYWRYGGSPAAIYTSIDRGRPQGMPAWGRALPPQKLWQLTAYVGALGGGVAPEQALAALHGDIVGNLDTHAQDNAAEGGNALEGQ